LEKDIIKLLIADFRTGIVLDENYKLFNKSIPTDKTPYIYFNDLESAIDYININKVNHTNVEFTVLKNDKPIYEDFSKQDLITNLYLTPNFIRSKN
jgi:uncharacterized protein with ATP-grasp and redox domains